MSLTTWLYIYIILKARGNRNVLLLNVLKMSYLRQILIRQEMQLPRFEAVLTFTFVEEVRLEFPAGVFFCGRHYLPPLLHSVGFTLDDLSTVGF